MFACSQGRWRRQWFAKVCDGVVEENPPAGSHAGATAGGQHTRAPAHVQLERGVRQAAAQGAHVRVRETPVPDRDPPAGHHVHQLHDRTAAVHAVSGRWRWRCGRRSRRGPVADRRVRSAATRRPVRAVLVDTARLGADPRSPARAVQSYNDEETQTLRKTRRPDVSEQYYVCTKVFR